MSAHRDMDINIYVFKSLLLQINIVLKNVAYLVSLKPLSQLPCDRFVISFQRISRHFRPEPVGTPRRHRFTLNSDLNPHRKLIAH